MKGETVHGATGRVIPMLRYRIATARREAELSRAQLARRLGIWTRVVADWERGVLRPSAFQMERLARVLHPGFGKARIWLRARGSSPGWRARPRDTKPPPPSLRPRPGCRPSGLIARRETAGSSVTRGPVSRSRRLKKCGNRIRRQAAWRRFFVS